MAVMPQSVEANLIRSNYSAFVRYAFRKLHGEKLGEQPYVEHLCHIITGFIDEDIHRLLINLPPQHLKSFVGTICHAAYLLGTNPRLRIIIASYNDTFAESLCEKVRDMMQSHWYQRAFATRIKAGHSRANDFATTEGGGVFAVSATGAITGRPADVVLYDDPHEANDWNNDRKLDLVWTCFNILLSRLNNTAGGRMLVIAHRVSENDLSSHLLQEKGWTHLRLPLIAVITRTYENGHEKWTREKEELLRPTAYPKSELERLKRTQIAPPFELFYQQGLGTQSSQKLHPDHFQSFAKHEEPIAPVVLSIDPGYGIGSNASRSVIQAWKRRGQNYYLLDQFCEQCDANDLRSAFWRFAKRYNPSVALIENTANGPALYSMIRKKAKLLIKLITPRRDAKAVRLNDHRAKIRGKRIFLPEGAVWREGYIAEFIAFPGEFDDQVDASTQVLDYLDTNPAIPAAPVRDSGAVFVSGANFLRRRY